MSINVSVMGPNRGGIDPLLHGFVLEVTNSFAKSLKINRFKAYVDIRLHHKYVIGDSEGFCEPKTDRAFKLDVCLYGNWMSTLAHEMVHVKQYLRRELNWSLTAWKGRGGWEDTVYWDQPWEIEARDLQLKLVLMYEYGAR